VTEAPLAAVEAALAADRAFADPALWIARIPDEAVLARAVALETDGPRDRPLWGVPFAVKDNLDVAGLPTTAACPGYAYVPEATAPAVQRLLDAGAVLLGKLNMDQFATGLVGTRSPYGTPRNPFDPARVPGGSSSGSAVAVAAGIARFALGTDTAGSGRVPAAFCNVVGLKPTLGSVSTRGLVPACRSLDAVSVFARTVDEGLDVLRVMADHDAADPYSRRAPFAHLRRGAAPAAARVAGIVPDNALGDAVAAPYARAASLLGAEVVDIGEFLAVARLLYDGPWVAERTAALRAVVEERPEILHPITRAILEGGLSRRTVDAFDAFHAAARARRSAELLFVEYDALLLPTTMPCPTLAAAEADAIGVNARLGTWTNFANLCDLAAIAVPAGLGEDGFPFGVTLLGPAWSESRLAPLADAVHRALTANWGASGEALPPSAPLDPVHGDETALFCIGAHMAGLPLNGQVTALGGRFVRAARTTPAYRLHALDGRPGLYRAPGGSAIEGEVWALPTASIGPLLAQVPPPLGFGTVELEDGPCLGFLAEPAGCAGAADITRLGGWRAWLTAARATAPG
jgi:allophanate hydrolase